MKHIRTYTFQELTGLSTNPYWAAIADSGRLWERIGKEVKTFVLEDIRRNDALVSMIHWYRETLCKTYESAVEELVRTLRHNTGLTVEAAPDWSYIWLKSDKTEGLEEDMDKASAYVVKFRSSFRK